VPLARGNRAGRVITRQAPSETAIDAGPARLYFEYTAIISHVTVCMVSTTPPRQIAPLSFDGITFSGWLALSFHRFERHS